MGQCSGAPVSAARTQTSHSVSVKIISSSDGESQPLRLPALNEALYKYEMGALAEENVAGSIIHELFNRDFSGDGSHWCRDWWTCEAAERSGESAEKRFTCQESATWDWKDIYSVASAKATIVFSPDRSEIRVEGYQFYCAG